MEKQTKHVDIVCKYFYPVAAGIETNILETYSVLSQMGWDVLMHTSKDTLTEKNVLPDNEVLRGIKIKRYAFNWYAYFPKIKWDTTDFVCLHNFNIIPHLYIMLYTLWLKIIGKKKFTLILTPHGGFNPEWSIFSPLVQKIKQFYHYTIGVFLINLTVDGMRAVSEWERLEIIKKGVKESIVVTIDNGLEDEAYMDLEALASDKVKEEVKSYGKYMIQVGRVYKIKNYETTINALAKLPEDIKYVIVGPIADHSYIKKLKDLAASLNLQDRVIFPGVVRGVDKYYLIKHAQLMVHMAVWESYCNVVHEGLSQGLVCVVANNTALPLLVKEGVNGYCVETFDQEALAAKLKHVLSNKDSEEIKKIENYNREEGLKNSWREVAQKMYNFYNLKSDENNI